MFFTLTPTFLGANPVVVVEAYKMPPEILYEEQLRQVNLFLARTLNLAAISDLRSGV